MTQRNTISRYDYGQVHLMTKYPMNIKITMNTYLKNYLNKFSFIILPK